MQAQQSFTSIPVIDLAPLLSGAPGGAEAVAAEIGRACRDVGFFYVRNHGVSQALIDRVFSEGHRFFEQPLEEKMKIDMKKSFCYRGFFKLGDELTSKRRDWKEGLYLGAELPLDHPKVRARVPMHGPNQWPDAHRFPGFDQMIVEYMAALTELGHRIMEAVALSLSLDRAFFRRHFTEDPFTPFRLFYYPVARSPAEAEAEAKGMRTLADTYAPVRPEELRDGQFGVARHTDYGILTILYQDESGGLQVENRCGQWIDAPPLPGTFVVNIGDMLETWTSGLYRATPHRVLKSTRRNRLSAPFFFDPSFDCEVVPLARAAEAATAAATAAQQQPIHYGSYILRKVQNNFPEYAQTLAAEAKAPAPPQPETKA